MDLETFDRLPSAALMRLVEVAMVAANHPDHRKQALAITEAASRVLIGPRMDMLVGSVMWMAGEKDAAAQVLGRAAEDPQVGPAAQAVLAVLLANDGRPEWQVWADRADQTRDPLQREMLEMARDLAVDGEPEATHPAEPADNGHAYRAGQRLGMA